MANNLGQWKLNSNFSECFNIGSVVSCRTCYHKEIEGEVLAFDSHTKILILKCPASDGQTASCDVNFVNLNKVSDVQVIKEANSLPPPPRSLSVQRLNHRLKNNVDDKKRYIDAMQAGVSPEGQNLYLTISKTIPDVKWEGPDMVILKDIRIVPPYKTENVSGKEDKGVTHIRKLVEKFLKDAQSAKKEIQKTNNNICVSSSNNSSNHSNSCAAPLSQQ